MERNDFYLNAYKVLLEIARNKGRAGVSTVTIINAQYICHDRGKMPTQEILNKWNGFLHITDVLTATSDNIFEAYHSNWNDIEDSIQYICAKKWNADCIVTRNKKDFALASIPVYTPSEFIAQYTR